MCPLHNCPSGKEEDKGRWKEFQETILGSLPWMSRAWGTLEREPGSHLENIMMSYAWMDSQDSQIRGFHCEQAVLGGTKYLWRGQLAMSHFGEAPKVVPAKKAKKVGDVLPKVRSWGRSYGQIEQLVHLRLEDTSREILRALQKNTQNLFFKREYLQSKRLMPLNFKSF